MANVPLTNEAVAAGITPEGNLLLIRKDWSSGQWRGTTVDMGKALAGAQAVLKMVDHDNWTLAAVAGGELQYFSGRDGSVGAGPYVIRTPRSVTRFVLPSGLPGAAIAGWCRSTQTRQAAMPSRCLAWPLGLRERLPRLRARTGLAAEEDGKEGVVRGHVVLRFSCARQGAGWAVASGEKEPKPGTPSARTGRTSMLSYFAGGIRAAIASASFKSLASIR